MIIATFAITMSLNAVIPLLNIIMLAFLLINIAIDKFSVFKVYKTPLNYQNALHKHMRKVFYVMFTMHFIVTPLLLSEPYLIPDSQTNTFSI
jgi:hypothetical protein